jgi:hypothetical protein
MMKGHEHKHNARSAHLGVRHVELVDQQLRELLTGQVFADERNDIVDLDRLGNRDHPSPLHLRRDG